MQENISAQMRAVTISREYGSGGGEVARRLAEKLGWQLIDHEVVVRIARILGVSEYEVEGYDEHSDGVIARMLSSMRAIDPTLMVAVGDIPTTSDQAYDRALRQVVEAAAREGHVVIVGRGGQMLLQDARDILHVRIIAETEKRVAYVMQREGLDHDVAQARIQHKDRERERYLQAHYHLQNSDAHLYDLVLNTSILDLDSIVELVCKALQRKATLLKTSEQELGPATGATKYPGQPGDLHSPADKAH